VRKKRVRYRDNVNHFLLHYTTYLFSIRKKSCFLSEHVPFVLKLDDVMVTSPS